MRLTTRLSSLVMLIAALAISSVSLCAQEPVYKYSQAEVESAINSVVKSYATNDIEKQDRYRKVLTDAFARYWTLVEVQASVGPNTLTDLQAKADSLTSSLTAKGNPQVEIDSLSVLLSQYLSLVEKVQNQELEFQTKQKEISDYDKEIANVDSELSQLKDLQGKFTQAQDSLKLVAENLQRIFQKAQSKDDFSAVDIEEIDDAINRYILVRKSIETFKTNDVAELDNAVKGLETLSSLKLLVDDAIAAMGAKFIPTRNKALIEDIRIEASKTGLTPGQKQLLTSVVTSLENEQAAVDNFLSILSTLPKDYYCVPDEDTRNTLQLDKYIIDKVQSFNSSIGQAFSTESTTYNPRYVQLNQVLSGLIEDLSPSSKMPVSKINTDEKFQKYLQSVASKVK